MYLQACAVGFDLSFAKYILNLISIHAIYVNVIILKLG